MNLNAVLGHKTAKIAVIAAALVFVLWFGVWWYAAWQYGRIIEGWIDAGRAAGYKIEFADHRLFGFPRHVVYRFTDLHWKNADGIEFRSGQIDLSARPWAWRTFEARFRGHAEIDTPLDSPDSKLVLAGENGDALVEIETDGTWTASNIVLEKASLGRSPDYLFTAERLHAQADRAKSAPKSHKDTGLFLYGEADGFLIPAGMPSPFGRDVAHLRLALRVMGTVPDFRKKASLAKWNSESGVIECDHLNLMWGPLLLAAEGTMGFDDDLQPEGAFSSTLGNHDGVLAALLKAGFVQQRQQKMLGEAMRLFAKPSKEDGVTGVQVPITVQLGGLFLGPVNVYSFPEIVWPETVFGETPPSAPPIPSTASPQAAAPP